MNNYSETSIVKYVHRKYSNAVMLSLALVLGCPSLRTKFQSFVLSLALRVKSLVLSLALRLESLVLALAMRFKSLVLSLALRLESLVLVQSKA